MESKILEQLAQLVLPSEILERFEIVKIETEEHDIDAMSMTSHLDEYINRVGGKRSSFLPTFVFQLLLSGKTMKRFKNNISPDSRYVWYTYEPF